MRSHNQQITEILKTLSEAQEKQLYSLCQECAEKLIDFVAKYKSNDAPIIELLEEYFRLLFLAHKNEISVKVLKKHFVKVEKYFNTAVKNEKWVVAFFPYKASMWDCMESVWFAAKDNPECCVYVIPIPYYDYLIDGQLGQMHYEGELLPDYVPITDWKDYNKGSINPDIAFIHNPYGKENVLTCIPENFQAANLRNNVSLLSFLPYTIHRGSVVREAHITTGGVLLSDIVFVQSDSIRQQYINHLFELTGKQPGAMDVLNSKIIALGSPKADKIINSKQFNYAIPDEWNSVATGKRVIFFNTSIGAMLNNTMDDDDTYLVSLKLILNYFKSCDTAILLWRPHPLFEQTFHSMRPNHLDEYLKIRDSFINEGYGIYDETADLHRAIHFSDAYFGDSSSVIPLFLISGKPYQLHDHINKDILPNFIENIENEIVNNDTRKEEYCGKFLAESSGQAGKKIFEHVMSRVGT